MSENVAEIAQDFALQASAKSLYAGRYKLYSPSDLAKYGRRSNKPVFVDPYNSQTKARFEDAWRAEPMVRNAINVKVSFILGRELPVGVDTRLAFADNDEREKALEGLLGKDEIKNYQKALETINKRVRFKQRVEAAVAQCKVGGRSALGIQFGTFNEREEPQALRVLNWVKLGRVQLKEISEDGQADYVIDRVYYNEEPFDKQGIPASSLLYFTNLDNHMSPNTLFYGYSDIEPIAHLSETNRFIDEAALKEINRSLFAGNLLIKMATKDRSVVQELLNNFDPGKPIGTNKETSVEHLKIEHDLMGLIAERDANDKRILRALKVPSFLLGFEDVTNRATSSAVLHAWKVSELDNQQSWLRDILDSQWYDSNFMVVSGMDAEAVDKLEYRFTQNFQEIIFDEFADKADAVIKLFNAKIIPLEKALEILGFKDVLEEAQKLQDEMKEQQQAEFDIKADAIKNKAKAVGAA